MILSHSIQLDPTPSQREYFSRASGCSRFVWNWALAEWKRQFEAGLKPNAMLLKKQFNVVKYAEFPWMAEVHRDAHSQPFANLAKAWSKFFADVKAGKKPNAPVFKKRGLCRDSFYVANDKFKIDGKSVFLPKIGEVRMREALRFHGKIVGATVSRSVDRWFIAIQVEVADANLQRTGEGIVGVDLGVKAAATLSTGEAIKSPQPLKRALRRLKIRGRRHSKSTKGSNNRKKLAMRLAALHRRIANVRADFCHKLTSRLCRENQAVVIEDLNVKDMLKHDRLARPISDVGFGMIRSQLEYKSLRYGTRLVVADRWYPSSRLCSCCGWKNETLTLADREWVCPECGASHDRDVNAARNLKRLATATALPVAKVSADTVGKVTPVSYEVRLSTASGQELTRAHPCAHL